MAIDLLSLEPHKVSRDLSGYITYIYGSAKTGKTTFASQMPAPIILAFEKGYNALPGVLAQDMLSWKDMKDVVKQLKNKEVKEKFKSVIIDTVDIAGSLCERYICSQAGVDSIGEIPYGQGWTKVKKEFENVCRDITQQGYALVFISHDKDKVFKTKNGLEYNQVVPTCPNSFNNIAKDMADIYAYAEKYTDEQGTGKVRLIMRSPDNSAETGCRFKYMKPVLEDFNYQNVVDALNEAIDKEAALNGNKYVTDEREAITERVEYDYDALMNEFQDLAGSLMGKDGAYYGPRITQIIERYLGKGKKISDTSIDQAEFISLIVADIKEDLMK